MARVRGRGRFSNPDYMAERVERADTIKERQFWSGRLLAYLLAGGAWRALGLFTIAAAVVTGALLTTASPEAVSNASLKAFSNALTFG